MNENPTQVDKLGEPQTFPSSYKDEIDSSLVFGNDLTHEHDQQHQVNEKSMENSNHDIAQGEVTQTQKILDWTSSGLQTKDYINSLPDTQKIPKQSEKLPETQVIPSRNENLADTQVILRFGNDTNKHSDTQIIPTPEDSLSRRQVINTQEQIGKIDTIDNETYEDKDIVNHTNHLEIQTDEEDIGNGEEEFRYGYDDSLLNHQMKFKTIQRAFKKGNLNLRRGNTFDLAHSKTKPTLERNYSVPLVLASSQENYNNNDISLDDINRSFQTDKGGDDVTINTTVAGQLIPPSSPEKSDQNMSKDFSLDASEIEEPDQTDNKEIEEKVTEANTTKETLEKMYHDLDDDDDDDVIPKKRRLQNTIESQVSATPFILREEKSDILTDSDIIHKSSVWASFNLKMYTGRISTKFIDYANVVFFEGSYEIKNQDLNLLDIRIGDCIHIKSNNTTKYTVTGLSNLEPSEKSDNFIKCLRGYDLVHLKTSRKNSKEKIVPLSECFMELSDWVIHQQKFKLLTDEDDFLKSVPSTPKKAKSSKRLDIELISPSKYSRKQTSQMLNGKLFCLTNITSERKDYIKDLIENNGGLILEKELNEIFKYESDTNLYLEGFEFLENVNFAAILSNNYCRSPKYLQGLALGWPIISDAFIIDLIENRQLFNNWSSYLLPSGEAKDLNCVKSIDVYKFRLNYEKGFNLSQQLKNNNHMLNDYHILIINSRNSKQKKIDHSSLETCKFIFHCFGAKNVNYLDNKTSTNFKEIMNHLHLIKEENSKVIVYVNDEGNDIESKLKKEQVKRRKGFKLNLRFVNWEWVVQCVISGYIKEEKSMTVTI